MQRISVVGTSGSGKSYLARALAEALAVPYVELDALFWKPDWVQADDEEFIAKVRAATAGDRWVTDGNYGRLARAEVWRRVDTVVWLDLPRAVVMAQVVWRTLSRAIRRTELWSGNRESWRSFATRDPQKSIIVWAWANHGRYRAQYAAAMADPVNAHLRFIRITGRAQARRLIAQARAR